MNEKKAVFMDRDGIINKTIGGDLYPLSPESIEDFELYDPIWAVLNKLKEDNFLIIIVTNQPDIPRGRIDENVLKEMHEIIRRILPVDDIFVCLHDDNDFCICRKPKPGMLLEAAMRWNIDLTKSFMVGDTWRDMEAGKRAGCTTILLDKSYNKGVECDFRAMNHEQICSHILRGNRVHTVQA